MKSSIDDADDDDNDDDHDDHNDNYGRNMNTLVYDRYEGDENYFDNHIDCYHGEVDEDHR